MTELWYSKRADGVLRALPPALTNRFAEEIDMAALRMRACAHCGKPFTPKSPATDYCGWECYLWSRAVGYGEAGRCWLYFGRTNEHGYGIVTIGRKRKKAHRLAWEFTNGPIPDGLIVCHRCDTPQCVNPGHLFLGTHEDNTRDMMAKGRHRDTSYVLRTPEAVRKSNAAKPRGEDHHKAKLTAEQVKAIRSDPRRSREVARDYGISMSAVGRIWSREVWADVPAEPNEIPLDQRGFKAGSKHTAGARMKMRTTVRRARSP